MQREGSYNFRGVSMSASGQYQTCVANQSNIWWSDDYGSNWTVVNTAGVALWDTAVSGNGTTVTYTAANSFKAGQKVTITGIATTAYNLSNVIIATATATQFTVTPRLPISRARARDSPDTPAFAAA